MHRTAHPPLFFYLISICCPAHAPTVCAATFAPTKQARRRPAGPQVRTPLFSNLFFPRKKPCSALSCPLHCAGGSARTDGILRERGALHSAERGADTVIEQALESMDSLKANRSVMTSIAARGRALVTRFPMVDSLITNISARSQRNKVILASFIAFCMFALFWLLLPRKR